MTTASEATKLAVHRLTERLRDYGLEAGDTVLVHSSLSRLLAATRPEAPEFGPGNVLQSLLAAVGGVGTVLLPLFNFDFTHGAPFDIRTTPSQMGALTEIGRTLPGSQRTGNPIYSFAALGAEAGRFGTIDNFSGYGPDSPFAVLRELDGKIAILDLEDQDSMTFYHHVEEIQAVPYRYHKQFAGNYTDSSGQTNLRRYGLFVRDVKRGVLTDVNRMGERLWREGLYTGALPGVDLGLRLIRARDLYAEVKRVIDKGEALNYLYSVEPPR